MVVQEQTLYTIGAVLSIVAMVALAVLTRRYDGYGRRHVLVLPVALGVLALGYAGMALDVFVFSSPSNEPVYFTRFGTYLLTYTYLMTYVGLVAGARFRYRIVPGLAVVGFTAGGALTQMTTAPMESVGSLLVLVSVVAVFVTFFGPLTSAAASVSRERRLLFSKLRTFAALVFIMYVFVALINRSGAVALLDAFTGVFLTAYVDLIAHVGLAGIIIYSQTAVDGLAAEYSSPFAVFTDW